MQPHGCGTGSAIERERDGALRFILHAVEGVGGEKDLRAGFFHFGIFFLVIDLFLHDHCAGCDGVFERLAANTRRMFCNDDMVLGGRFFFFFLFGFVLFFGHGVLLICVDSPTHKFLSCSIRFALKGQRKFPLQLFLLAMPA